MKTNQNIECVVCDCFIKLAKRLLTIENNNVKLPIAKWLVYVGDPGPKAARLLQGQSEQNLALWLVK